MTVKELIAELEKLNPKLTVYVLDDHGEACHVETIEPEEDKVFLY